MDKRRRKDPGQCLLPDDDIHLVDPPQLALWPLQPPGFMFVYLPRTSSGLPIP